MDSDKSPENMINPANIGKRGVAVVLNNTATDYHWGCFGTSMAIVNKLLEAGYFVESFSSETTHTGLPDVPPKEFSMAAYEKGLMQGNFSLWRALRDSDIVVINGEGTIHSFHKGPKNLLGLIQYLKKHLNKPVHLINHSCYPSGGREPAAPEVEAFYRASLSCAETVVVREPWSQENYARLGIKAGLGFDCLPLYYDKYLKPLPEVEPCILIGGAVQWKLPEIAALSAALVELVQRTGLKVHFLAGGYRREPTQDEVQFKALRSVLGDGAIGILRPTTISEWLAYIKASPLFITGRFHHLIAASVLGTPVVMMPSNTCKTEAVCHWLGLPTSIDPNGPDFIEKFFERADAPASVPEEKRAEILAAAERNFEFLG